MTPPGWTCAREDAVLEAVTAREWDRVPELLREMHPHERQQLTRSIEKGEPLCAPHEMALPYRYGEMLMTMLDDIRMETP